MSDQSSAVKKSNKQAAAATGTLQGAETAYLGSSQFPQIEGIINSILDNPLTMTPQAQDAMYRTGVSDANAGAKDFLSQRLAQLQGYGGTGYRSGAARNAEFEAGAKLGEGLANSYRQTQLAMAQQRVSDLVNAANAGTGFLQGQFNLGQAVANAQLGAANIMNQNAQIPSPTAQLLGGIGSLGGTLGSAAFLNPGNKGKG